MEPEGSLPHLQAPAACPYPEPDQSSPCVPPNSRHCLWAMKGSVQVRGLVKCFVKLQLFTTSSY